MRTPAVVLAALAFSLAGRTRHASAEPRIEVFPVLGPDTPSTGWLEFATRIENPDPKPWRGRIEIASSLLYEQDGLRSISQAPFSVGPGRTAILTLPAHGFASGPASMTMAMLDESGRSISSSQLLLSDRSDPLLLDLHTPSKLAAALRGTPVPVAYEARHRAMSGHPLAVGQPPFDPATGDPILPARTAGLSAATVVVASSDTLARASGAELDALVGYVLSGGSLALVLAKPEDLRHANLIALTGGTARVTAPRAGSLAPLSEKPPAHAVEEDAPDPLAPDPFAPHAVPSPKHLKGTPHAAPSPPGPNSTQAPSTGVVQRLVGFEGGNLQPSSYGATAACGLGEVHLLGFDPTRQPDIDDPWVQARMVDLVRHAWDRRAPLVFPHGSSTTEIDLESTIDRQLDPNESSRWAVIVAALLLLGYGIVAGPINFRSAAKRGQPLRALFRLPLFSAGTAVAIVLTGVAAKGCTGRARHLSLLEMASGTPRGTARRWRGFFLPSGQTLEVRSTEPNGVLDAKIERPDPLQRLVVDRQGVRLTHLAAPPWQTVVVREDGFATLGAGVSLLRKPDSSVVVTNRTGRVLRAAIVVIPGDCARYFPVIKDGDSVRAGDGRALASITSSVTAGSMDVHRLETAYVAHTLDADAAGVSSAWSALAMAAGPYVDWFPDGEAVVLAQLEGGEGRLSDSGITLESDRALVRVLGFGGSP